MPWTREMCEQADSSGFGREREEYCLRCDHFLPEAMDVRCTASVEFGPGITQDIFDENREFLRTYKDLFRSDTLLDDINTGLSDTDYPEDHILTRTIAGEELETFDSLQVYEDRRQKCNSLKCGEDCKNDDDCYMNIPFDLNENSRSRCSCEPNIFLNADSLINKESLQERLADEFYNIYAEELQRDCDLTSSATSLRSAFLSGVDRYPESIESHCLDLERTLRISEAIFSSPKDSNVMNIYETCLDREGDDHRENILKHCLSRPIVICDDENDENDETPDCIHLDLSYYKIIKDIFGYYVLRNTSYENPYRCECNLLEINEEGPPHYSFNEKEYLHRVYCEDSINGIPRGICEHNMPIVQSYLDANEGLITDEYSARYHMTGILNKNKCERRNSIKHNDIDYFHSRLYCDPSNDNIFNLTDDMDQMIENNYYEEVSEYNIGTGPNSPQSAPDNNLRKWNSETQEYNINEIDYSNYNCTSNIHRCMGFEPKVKDGGNFSDFYEKILDSHYYLLPLDVSHTTRDIGYIRYYSALNNHYLGDLTFDFPYGQLYGYMIENIYNITSATTSDAATALEEQYDVVQNVRQGISESAIVLDGQAADEMGSIDRLELEETLLTVYKIDYLNKIRDYGILAILLICSVIFLYLYSYIILFVHIPWIILYISYIKIKEFI